MDSGAAPGCMDTGCLSSTLPTIPHWKLTDLYYLNRGGYGTVFKAQHSDWRITVATKCLKLGHPVRNRERNALLKEAEVLHKARFSYIIQILGVCNEPEFFCIVTEFMSNGSLDLLLHKKDTYPNIAWPLRLRILYEIALGVNYLHTMDPPLLHHDLKTQNVLLDDDYHVKIADFGLSKWRQFSTREESSLRPFENEGTRIYMPPEEYGQIKSPQADMKHDMYSYAIIMWEVLSRRIPFEEETQPMKVIIRVVCGARPDTSLSSLPALIPGRETLVGIMSRGWTINPEERPSFQECLMELEPLVRSFDVTEFLEAVLEIKKSKKSSCSTQMMNGKSSEFRAHDMYEGCSNSGSDSSQSSDISQPGNLISSDAEAPKPSPPSSLMDQPQTLVDGLGSGSHSHGQPTISKALNNLNIEPMADEQRTCETQPDKGAHRQYAQTAEHSLPLQLLPPSQGPMASWIEKRREEIVAQMTDACLNQILDALLARSLLMHEDYELVGNKPTRTAKVRQLLDNCHKQNEDFCYIVVHKLHSNRQNRLQPYPPEVVASSQSLSSSLNIARNL